MRQLLLIGIVCSLLSLFSTVSYAESNTKELAQGAKSAILIDRDTGSIIFEKGMNDRLPPASMTKVMTLLLIMEAIDEEKLSFDEEITVSENASSMGGSQVFLETGEVMTVDDLVKAIAIASGNDASVALAERIAGSEAAFTELMNKKAKELGLQHTNFQNASGLPAKNHYSTAHDMAMIAKELLKYEKITKYTSIYEDYLRKGEENEFWLVNTNKLVHFYPYIDGLKTGYTSEAKFCLTATGKKDDMRLIAVVMGAETVKERNSMTMQLIDYGFNHYEVDKLFDKNEQVAELEILKSEKQSYPVKTSEQISLLYKKGTKENANVEKQVNLTPPINLPLKKGEPVGEIIIKENNQKLTSPLVLEEELKPATYMTLFKRVMGNIAKYDD